MFKFHAYLIADDLVLFLVVQRGDRKAPLVVWINIEVDVSEMGEILVDWIWGHIVPWQLLVGRCKTPAYHKDISFLNQVLTKNIYSR